MKPGAQPVIIVRRKKHAHAHHGGAWKVAYADFVTAMMAFFLVMWLAAQDSTIRTAIAGYFQEPGLLPHQQSNSILASGQGGIDNAGTPTVVQRKPNGYLEAEQRALVAAAEHIRQHMSQFGGGPLRGQVEVTMTADGLRAKAFFPYGRLAQSIAFFSPPGIERLYSGVTNNTASTAAIASFKAAATGG